MAKKKKATKTNRKQNNKPRIEALPKAGLMKRLSERAGVELRGARAVLDTPEGTITGPIHGKGVGEFRIPGLLKITSQPVAMNAFAACLLGIGAITPASAETQMSTGSVGSPPLRDLVIAEVAATRAQTLPSHHVAWAVGGNESGAVPEEIPLQHLSIELNRTAERERAFQQLLVDQQSPMSPRFHLWLTPVEIGERYGASQHDIDAVASWLTSQGMTAPQVANSRTRIVFNGTAGAVSRAFKTQLRYFTVGSDKRIGNADDPHVPEALAPIIRSVRGLSTERYYPQHTSQPSVFHPQSNTSQPYYTACSGSVCRHALFPADFATIFNINSTLSQGISGNGQKIAIVGRQRVNPADLQNFMQLAGVTFALPNVIVPPNGIDPGPPATTCTTTGTNTCSNPNSQVSDQSEATLDVTRASSVAPSAAIDLIVSSDTNTGSGITISTFYAIDTNPPPAKVLSISFGGCEADNGAANTQSEDALFQQGAAEGISILVSSGDSGVAGCNPPNKLPPTVQTPSINLVCASGSVTCVGGTEFADQSNPSAYWSSTNSAGNESALGYIPEGAWNDPLAPSGQTRSSATGGGVSSYIATPSWQTGLGVPGMQGRYTPDVSFPAYLSEGYFHCFAAAGATCVITNGSAPFELGGGTSASAPSMAGIVALLDQEMGDAQGNLNPRLYALAANPSNGVFHDVTVESSGVVGCSLSTPSMCNNSTPGPTGLSAGLHGYSVGTGYDLATGWGSINVGNLLASWKVSNSSINLGGYMSGNWFIPSLGGGLGFQLEFTNRNNDMIAIWFAYTPAGSTANNGSGQNWIYSEGPYDTTKSTVTLPAILLAGARFPPDFHSADVHRVPNDASTWGTITFSFNDCNNGTVRWHSDLPGYNNSNDTPLAIRRLTQIAGTTCPQ